MKVERFEDLVAWQKARSLTCDIYRITRHGIFAKDFGLSNQIQRAAVIDQQHFDRLLTDAEEVARILGGLRAAVERQRNEQRGKL